MAKKQRESAKMSSQPSAHGSVSEHLLTDVESVESAIDPLKETVMASAQGLETYLNDHLAGAAGGSELASKISSEYAGTRFGPFLAELARDIEQDKTTLEELMDRLGMQQSAIKQGASWIAEKISRLKLSETMTGDQDLKRFMEFETLSLGIEGKLLLWRALIEIRDSHAELAATDLDRLAKRAESQRSNLEDHRLQVANAALTG
ncbi:MAG: hypothetical protein ACRDST_19775 [Pseudonocardiaceae bacterium]